MKHLPMRRPNLKTLLALALAGAAATACTKPRDLTFGDGAGQDILEIENFRGKALIETGSPAVLAGVKSERAQLLAASEDKTVPVSVRQAPEAIRYMFQNLHLQAPGGKTYPVVFRLTTKQLTAYKLVADEAELSPLERELAREESKYLPGQAGHAVPIFAYEVRAVGRVVRVKDDLKQQTHRLRLEETELGQATHVQLSPLSYGRQDVAPDREDARHVYVREAVDGVVTSSDRLMDLLQAPLPENTAAATKQLPLYLQLNGKVLYAYEIASEKTLRPDERTRVQQFRRGFRTSEIAACPAPALAALKAENGADDCILIARGRKGVSLQKVKRSASDNAGTRIDPAVKFEDDKAASSRLVRVTKGAFGPAGDVELSDDQIPLAQVANREFLFRRTLEDTPNGFDYTFPGSAGNLEIVKFRFVEGRVQLVRADALLRSTGANDIDREVLVSVPAAYYVVKTVDEEGQPLRFPRYERASHRNPDAIAFVSWNFNETPDVSSPMDYYSLGQCFSTAGRPEVTDLDNRLDRGDDAILSFSVRSHLAANPGVGCVDLYGGDYFSGVQATFQFRERFSLKRYQPRNGEKPLLDVPYEAQRMLGFGLFTYKRLEPNANGNTGRIGTEKPLPALWDIREGRQIKYVLAGLPPKGEYRERLIQATREVVADLNRGFRQALEGTPMARAKGPEGDVVTLEIQDDESSARMGDLDRNYIYLVNKKTSSGIIGLGGSHQNPRSGIVEAGSVFMYTGNILSAVESMRLRADALAEYRKNMTPQPEQQQSLPEGDVVPPAGSGSGEPPALAAGNAAAMAARARVAQGDLRRDPRLRALLSQGKTFASLPDAARAAIGAAREPHLFLHDAIRAAADEGTTTDPRRLSNHLAAKYAATLGRRAAPAGAAPITARERQRLVSEGHRQHAVSTLMERLRLNNYCLYEASDARLSAMAASEDSAGKSDLDLAIAMYKPTLAHEIGHNIGLRHNFAASYDGAHHKFSPDEDSKRTYSSVMDYLADDHETYDGLGPQDVASLRAAYAGLVEMDPKFAEEKLGGRRFVPIQGYLNLAGRVAGVQTWHKLTDRVTTQLLPVKGYRFCTDEDVLNTPTCNRFDQGTTPLEIVENAIRDYQAYYALTNFPNDRIRFNWYDTGAYAGRIFSTFMPIRMMVEETIYQAIKGGDPQPYAQAAIRGLFFLHGVVRTPDASPLLMAADQPEARFETLSDGKGSSLVVERKWVSDLGQSESSPRLKVRGVEIDKLIALILLTERRLGFAKYERESIRISYPEFERLVTQSKDTSQLPTVALLTELMQGNVGAALGTSEGFVGLPASFKVNATDGMRFYAILGAIMNMDVDGTEVADNLSSNFRIMSGFQAPAGESVVTAPGASLESRKELKYWAGENARAAARVIDRLALHTTLSERTEALKPLVSQWLVKKFLQPGPEQPERTQGKPEGQQPEDPAAEFERALDAKLAELPESAGPRTMAEIGPVVGYLLQAAANLQPLAERASRNELGEQEQLQLAYSIEQIRMQVETEVKSNPTLGLILEGLPEGQNLGLAALDGILARGTLAGQRAQLFSSVRLLNQIFLAMHPEYATR